MPSLADLKARLGLAGTSQDELLQQALDASTAWVNDRVHAVDQSEPDAISTPPYINNGWNFDALESSGAPAVGFFRVDDVDEPTVFYLHPTDRLGNDMTTELGGALAGDRVVGVQLRNAHNFAVVDIGAPVDQTTHWEIPVALGIQAPLSPLATGQAYVFVFRHFADVAHADVAEAILLIASRLYRRRLTPEGVAGWADIGAIRIAARDPDVQALLEFHIDVTWAVGIA